MNHENWHVLPCFVDGITAQEIIAFLEPQKHKAIYRFNMYEGMHVGEAEKLFEDYIGGKITQNIPNLDSVEKIMRSALLQQYGSNRADADFINRENFSIKKVFDRFTDITPYVLDELKLILAINLKTETFKHPIYNNIKLFTADKMRFTGVKDFSFEALYLQKLGYFTEKLENSLHTWYELDKIDESLADTMRCESINIIITDDLSDISNFLYYVNIFETKNNFVMAINDNKNNSDKFLKNDYSDILANNESRFVKFTDTMIKDL